MKLSKRLEAIANLVDTKRVIDVGCDHGYLDIYLTLYNDIQCIACDISKSAIKGCLDNIDKYNLKDKIEVVVTDGINGIKINSDDTIILSGMGTSTIINILKNKKLSNTIIISTHNKIDVLRRFMVSIGYIIDNEIYVMEHNIPYIIIKFIRGDKEYNDFDYILGPFVIKDNNYRKYIVDYYCDLLNKIPDKHDKLKKYYQNIVNYIKN